MINKQNHPISIQIRINFLLLLFCLTFFVMTTICHAEGYGNYFLYKVDKISQNVLVDTVGMVSIGQKDMQKKIEVYEQRGKTYFLKNSIQIENTYPVSKGGYGGYHNYLVTSINGEYLKIILDPYRDLRGWIRLKQTTENKIIVFSELMFNNQKLTEEIDIFLLANKRKLYKEPKKNSVFVSINKTDQNQQVFYPVSFKNDYIQIGIRFFNDDHIKVDKNRTCSVCDGETIGWIKARNHAGKISFFLYVYSWY